MQSVREPAAVHLAGLVSPLVTLAGLLIGGAWAAAGVVLVLGLYPLVDLALGEAAPRREPDRRSAWLEVLPWVHGILQVLMLVALARLVAGAGWSWVSLAGCLSAGIHGGCSAIVLAHELGHRRPGSPGWRLGRLLLYSVLDPHFTTEHNRGHHRRVATAADPVSAPAGRGFWSHLPRTVAGQLRSAAAPYAAQGRTGLANPVHRGLATCLVVLAILAAAPAALGLAPELGLQLAAAWVLTSLVAVVLLEYTNYLQHYGLTRAPGERQTAAHSWQSTARWSRWTLFELPLHPAHHLAAAVPFDRLEAEGGAPRLPAGYYACFWPATCPPLWRRWMARHLPAGSQSPGGSQPSR